MWGLWLLISSAYLAAGVNGENDSNLKEAISSSLGIPEDRIVRMLRDITTRVDSDGDGKIKRNEMEAWFVKVYFASNDRHAMTELRLIDKNHDLKVSEAEILEAMLEADSQSAVDANAEMLSKRVKIADLDKDGLLDAKELSYLMSPGLLPELLEVEVDEVMQAQDVDKDGYIQYAEFDTTGHGDDPDGDSDAQQLRKEFQMYDQNNDNKIDKDEVKMAFQEPRPALVSESMHEIMGDLEEIMVSEILENWVKFAKCPMTDRGQLLRFPRDYPLDMPLDYDNIADDSDEYGEDQEEDSIREEL